MTPLQKLQLHKKRLLEREFAWIKQEFMDVHTLSDISICNVDVYGGVGASAVLHSCQ